MARDETYYEAEKKIQEALKSVATELDLRSMKLTELPEEIGHLIPLEELNLYQNRLTTLPDSIRHLTNLKRLLASRNKFEKIPEVVFDLLNLENLTLYEIGII